MPKENETKQGRVNVGIQRNNHQALAATANLLGRDVQDCADEAIADWNKKNAAAAKKKAGQLLTA